MEVAGGGSWRVGVSVGSGNVAGAQDVRIRLRTSKKRFMHLLRSLRNNLGRKICAVKRQGILAQLLQCLAPEYMPGILIIDALNVNASGFKKIARFGRPRDRRCRICRPMVDLDCGSDPGVGIGWRNAVEHL